MMDKFQDAWEEELVRTGNNQCWYEERWYEEDLKTALKDAGVEITVANLKKLKKRCVHIFDDKSVRNEMLVEMARKMDGDR
ncbi:MAG: hypothetical protein LUC99_11805 [Clostridiales bacterium]|nr:hypothetical protein [Clostridiales bacterium]